MSYMDCAERIPRAAVSMFRESFAKYPTNGLAAIVAAELGGQSRNRHGAIDRTPRGRLDGRLTHLGSSRCPQRDAIPDLVRPKQFHCGGLERPGSVGGLTFSPSDFDVEPADCILRPHGRPSRLAGADVVEVLRDERSVRKGAIQGRLAEPTDGTLAATVDREPASDPLAPTLASHADVDDRTRSPAHLINAGDERRARGGDREWLPLRPRRERVNRGVRNCPVSRHATIMTREADRRKEPRCASPSSSSI